MKKIKQNLNFLLEKIVFYNNKIKFILSKNKIEKNSITDLEENSNEEIRQLLNTLGKFGINYKKKKVAKIIKIDKEYLNNLFNDDIPIDDYEFIVSNFEKLKNIEIQIKNILNLIQ